MRKPKIVCWDLETLPLTVTSWSLYKPFLTHDNIITDVSICCGTIKPLGGKPVSFAIQPDAPNDDRDVTLALRDRLVDADVIVHHNGDKFDLPVLNTRLIKHGFDPLPPIATVDTKKLAFRRFRFSCAKLDYLAQFLGLGAKIPTSFKLWLGVMAGDPEAIRKMVRYNVGDVKLEELVYLKMRAFDERHPNVALISGRAGCTVCGGHLRSRGLRFARSRSYRLLRCTSCGHYDREARSVESSPVVAA